MLIAPTGDMYVLTDPVDYTPPENKKIVAHYGFICDASFTT